MQIAFLAHHCTSQEDRPIDFLPIIKSCGSFSDCRFWLHAMPFSLACWFLAFFAFFPFTAESFVLPPSNTATMSWSSSSSSLAVAQYAPQAAALFNNMKTPAAIIGGAVIPLGFLGMLNLDEEGDDRRRDRVLRPLLAVAAVVVVVSELLTVIWATVATNQLIETTVAPAESVWHLLQRDYPLEWAATNAHFVTGMYGFLFLIAGRMYIVCSSQGAAGLGVSLARMSGAGLCLACAVVNRGVASGGGLVDASGHKLRFGGNVLALGTTYTRLLWRRATTWKSLGVLELSAMGLFVWSVIGVIRFVMMHCKSSVIDSANKEQ